MSQIGLLPVYRGLLPHSLWDDFAENKLCFILKAAEKQYINTLMLNERSEEAT
ncbi:MAG: hypothetical protein R6U19_09105 [Bacteroidales bacterium]